MTEHVDTYSPDGIGWARFSEDRKLRYRLGRLLRPSDAGGDWQLLRSFLPRVVFVMLNPSTADAFKLDPTVSKCAKFAALWGADVLEVVNLFAYRSPHPTELDLAYDRGEMLGMDPHADGEILDACSGAARVIAAWGNNGVRHGRDERVRDLLRRLGVKLEHLGVTQGGHPLHPLARGKAFIPLSRTPEAYT